MTQNWLTIIYINLHICTPEEFFFWKWLKQISSHLYTKLWYKIDNSCVSITSFINFKNISALPLDVAYCRKKCIIWNKWVLWKLCVLTGITFTFPLYPKHWPCRVLNQEEFLFCKIGNLQSYHISTSCQRSK